MSVVAGPNITTSGLVLYLDASNNRSYPGTGTTWTDLSGNGLSGTLTNGPTYSSANSGSIVFDGTNDFVALGSPSALNLVTAMSISVWIKTNSTSYRTVFARGRGGPSSWDGYELGIGSAGTPRATSQNAAGTAITFDVTSSKAVNDNVWHHIVFSYGSSTGTIYVDGISSGTATGTFSSNSWENYVGRRLDPTYFIGNIAQVAIYNRALSASEIAQNFNATRSRFGI